MDTARVYYNTEGSERTIWQMIKEEPEWAAARVQEGEKAIERVKELEAAICQHRNTFPDEVLIGEETLWSVLNT